MEIKFISFLFLFPNESFSHHIYIYICVYIVYSGEFQLVEHRNIFYIYIYMYIVMTTTTTYIIIQLYTSGYNRFVYFMRIYIKCMLLYIYKIIYDVCI